MILDQLYCQVIFRLKIRSLYCKVFLCYIFTLGFPQQVLTFTFINTPFPFGDRSHCFQLPHDMVIFMSISQTVNIWSVLPFGVRSRPQGCSHQCFHLWHYTVRNTDLHGNWLLLQPTSGTEGGWKPDGNSGACLGNPIFTTRTCHQWYPWWLSHSTVPDTEPGSDPGTQKKR